MSFISVPDFLYTECFAWSLTGFNNICDQEANAWNVYQLTLYQLYQLIPGMTQYSTNWGNCMTCSSYRNCLASAPRELDKGLALLRNHCFLNYLKLELACPEIFLYYLVKAAATVLPMSPFVTLSSNLDTCLNQYRTQKPNAVKCYSTANSLYNYIIFPLYSNIPKTNVFLNFTVGNIIMDNTYALQIITSLTVDPVSTRSKKEKAAISRFSKLGFIFFVLISYNGYI